MAAPEVEGETIQKGESERFFRHFQQQAAELQDLIDDITSHNSHETGDLIDRCATGISQLSDSVRNATFDIPAYDHRIFSKALQELNEKLQRVRSTAAPKPKFAFKKGPVFTARKNESALSVNDAAELARDTRREQKPGLSSDSSSLATTPAELRSPTTEQSDDDKGMNPTHVDLGDWDDQWIKAGPYNCKCSATASKIVASVVDMSVSETSPDNHWPTLTVKDVRKSLLICGHVDGAAHLTNIQGSIIVCAAQQFRLHESRDCDVYLLAGSRPIIEDCEGVRFAPFPEEYMVEGDEQVRGLELWRQVDDFKWLKSEPSPHWGGLEEGRRVGGEFWVGELRSGVLGKGARDLLKMVGLRT